jgi:hypothetical protein
MVSHWSRQQTPFEMSDSHNGEYKEYSRLGCGTKLSGTYVSVFRMDSTLPQREMQ